jgi:tripartite-type tricarboxylate transporter receptor subunit TctC
VVSAKPDGYTLLAGSSNEMAGTKFVNAAQKYDPAVDLTPVSLTAQAPNLWVAGAHVPVKTVDDFVKLAKANPGKYSYGSPGIGSTPHFSGELIKKTAGVYLVHIPYKGSPAMTSDLGGGNLDFAILSPMAAPAGAVRKDPDSGGHHGHPHRHAQGGSGAGGTSRAQGLCPERLVCFGCPKGLPPEVLAKLQKAIQTGLADPAIRQKLEAAGTPPAKGNESLAQVMRTDMDKYAELVKFARITATTKAAACSAICFPARRALHHRARGFRRPCD